MQLLGVLLILWTFGLVLSAAAFVTAARMRRLSVLGDVLHTELQPRGARVLGLAAMALALVVAFGVAKSSGAEPALAVAFLGLLLVPPLALAWWALPAPHDQRCGASGVQYGIDCLTFEALEAWRLTGDHLRFRLGGTWVAVAVPRALQAEVRAQLERACPDAESEFGA